MCKRVGALEGGQWIDVHKSTSSQALPAKVPCTQSLPMVHACNRQAWPSLNPAGMVASMTGPSPSLAIPPVGPDFAHLRLP